MYYRATDQAIPEETGTDVLYASIATLFFPKTLTFFSLLKQNSGSEGLLKSVGKRLWQMR